jgi:hypothetical protein
MVITYVNNKSSSFYNTGVGYTIQLVMKGSSICCTKGCTTQICINQLTSKVLKVSKITNTKHVSITLKSMLSLYYTYSYTISVPFSH